MTDPIQPPAPPEPRRDRGTADVVLYVAAAVYFVVAAILALYSIGLRAVAIGFG